MRNPGIKLFRYSDYIATEDLKFFQNFSLVSFFFFFYELFDSFFGLERYSDIKNLKGALQVRDFNILICLIDLM